ncbi:hypothetical protein B9479_001783 [Cryptococcus floricola]|uniref:Isovaleryl-CoA dehydrogenase, mitochondrial n=1 Tax=Cryptococcus floricola TaxID=2591691 RepID=A0A5D3B597_9TREE|nr:hypothetical protein B9479_001783 [Cryptococcus floricola]
MQLIPRSTSILLVRPSSLVSGCRAFSSYNPAIAGLTANQEEFRDAVHTFAQKEIAPRAAEIDKTNKLPSDIFPKLGEMGLLGVTVPEKWGGLGLGYLEHTIAMEEISRASASIGLSYGAHSNLMVNQLVRWGNEEQLSQYLPPLLTGEHVGSLAMSEPNAGSDVVSMRSNAVKGKEGEGWVLNGSKCWITNATVASTFLIYAKSDTSVAPSKGMTAFLVERGWKGFDVGEGLDKFGMRGSPTAELFFDNVNIPTSNVLGREGKGAGVLMSGLDLERLVLSGGPLGVEMGTSTLPADYAAGRLLRDSRLYTVGAGTQEIRRMLIGREFNVAFGNGE